MITNKEKNFISAVIYVHNNESHIKYCLDSINKILNDHFEKYEIICVNDDSNDCSVKKIKEFSSNVKNAVISIVNMSFYQGVELSMNAGVDLAIGDFVFEFDYVYVDYKVDTIMQIYQRSLEGFDIVSAAPKNAYKNSSKLFYSIFNHFSNSHYELRTETFRVLSRRVINRVHAMSKTIPYRKAVYANCGLKIDTIVYENTSLNCINADENASDKRKDVAIDSLVLFTDVAYKAAFTMTMFMMLVSIFIGIYTILVFLKNQPVAGWTTTMLFLAFGFFGIFGVFAIIIKYLALLIDLIFKKKSYSTESIEKITK